MSANQMPGSSGVRIAGDEYQWLHAWRVCMTALHENLTRNTTNPAIAVGIEEAGAGNGDDIVLHRAQLPSSYMQVKYAADHRTAINLAYLEQTDVLRKFMRTHKTLTADGAPVEIRLVTNRAIDPTDILLKDRDGRDGSFLPRAAEGGNNSDRGKARAAWAAVAECEPADLLAFLRDFRVDAAWDIDRLRQDVALLMTANGLRSDSVSISLCINWVASQVIAGHRRLEIDDIQAAVAALDLQAGSPWTTVSIATIKKDLIAEYAAVSVDWVDKISGTTHWTRVAPLPPFTWDDLASDIRAIPEQLMGHKRILVGGHMRQATGFLIGSELRRVMGYQVGIRQGDQLWTSEEATSKYALTLAEQVGDPNVVSGTAIIVNVSTDGAPDVIEWIKASGPNVNKIITATPAVGTGPTAVSSPSAANSLSVAIRDLARRHSEKGEIHLFLIGPLGLAVLLGHHWNRVTTTLVYEHLGPAGYVQAFNIDA